MERNKKIEEILEDFRASRKLYKEYSSKVRSLLKEILDINECRYVFIDERVKGEDSLKKKLENQVNFNSLDSVNDISGVRIVTYVSSDIASIEKLLPEIFKVEPLKVEERLGTDKVGYRSHHWLLWFHESRLSLPDYSRFKGMRAELQIRTVLQHAWAQIGHNQIYKPNVVLPEKIKRDFSLLAGLLEIADNEFNRISSEITDYTIEVFEKTGKGDFDIPIDSVSLRSYFENRFGKYKKVKSKFGPDDDMAEEIITELNEMNINTIKQLDSILPRDIDKVLEKQIEQTNYCGLARLVMIVYDKDMYFKKAWKKSWTTDSSESNNAYRYYGINLHELVYNYSD